MSIGFIVMWILDIIGAACLLARHATRKYGKVSMTEMKQEKKEEKALKELWKKEMG